MTRPRGGVRGLVLALAAGVPLFCGTAELRAEGGAGPARPDIGYVFPAGACWGTRIAVSVGGQNLRGALRVHVSGPGVTAEVVRHLRPLSRQQLGEMRRLLGEELRERSRSGKGGTRVRGEAAGKGSAKRNKDVPTHPLLEEVESLGPEELERWAARYLDPRHDVQRNVQIAETLEIILSVAPDAAPGDRELRVETPAGPSNPLRFQVGTLPEVLEEESLRPRTRASAPLDPPVVLNGQILAGDVDRARIRARRGQHLVVEARARRLVPFLADAVPGWFQATLALYGPHGEEVAFADDFRFDPDPVLHFEVPEDGTYEVEIRDALYRGREDFVYRLVVSERPFITAVFPLGAREGMAAVASLMGWNLAARSRRLETGAGSEPVRWAGDGGDSNLVAYAVDDLAECREREPNDTLESAQRIAGPVIVNGRVGRPGDRDVFGFTGRQGQEIVAEILGRRLLSPVDSVLHLADAEGRVISWNDDRAERSTGSLTHQADSYLRARLPSSGPWFVTVADVRGHGGEEYAYRLRVGPPRPDFEVYAAPSGLGMRAGSAARLDVHVVRRDGFDGAIDVRLREPAAGFVLTGGRVPPGRDSIRMTLTAPADPLDMPVAVELEALARSGLRSIVHPVVPAEDRLQAFLNRHLVPSLEMLVSVAGPRRSVPPVSLASLTPVTLRVGGRALVRFRMEGRRLPGDLRFALVDPPAGITLENHAVDRGTVALVLHASSDGVAPGFEDNLLVEAYLETGDGEVKDGTKTRARRRTPLGLLPAVPVRVVRR